MKSLSKDWLLCELGHRISMEASNELFEIAKKYFFNLMTAKINEGVTKNVPQFVHLRRLLYNNNVPDVKLEVAYLKKETGEIIVLDDLEKTPRSRYPANEYVKLYEIASVKVINIFFFVFCSQTKRFIHFVFKNIKSRNLFLNNENRSFFLKINK